MSNKAKNVIFFIAGAVTGSFATWKLVKTKYERIADEEIESVKRVFGKANQAQACENSEVPEQEPENESDYEPLTDDDVFIYPEEELGDYVHMVDDLGYSGKEEEGETKVTNPGLPYIIAPTQFGEFSDFKRFSLTYYEEDDILTDDKEEPIEDPYVLVGDDFMDHYGEYYDDAVYVRNEMLKADYEILLDTGAFYD